MCKHILNAQVAIRSPCCMGPNLSDDFNRSVGTGRKWFDCAECHAEQENHPLLQTVEMIFVCKKCKKAFRKDMREFEEADEYCPHCDNHFLLDAITPKAALNVESEDTRMDARMLKDDRVKRKEENSIFDVDDAAHRLG